MLIELPAKAAVFGKDIFSGANTVPRGAVDGVLPGVTTRLLLKVKFVRAFVLFISGVEANLGFPTTAALGNRTNFEGSLPPTTAEAAEPVGADASCG